MDFDFSDEQRKQLDILNETVAAAGGAERGFEISRNNGYDDSLDLVLQERLSLDGEPLLVRVLIAERLAQLGLATTFGVKALIPSDIELPVGAVTVADATRSGPLRYGAQAQTLVLIEGDDVRVINLNNEGAATTTSGSAFPYAGRHMIPRGGTVYAGRGLEARSWWRLGISAEICGNAETAIERTITHLTSRRQFGRPLASFQALRHRLAELAVHTEATKWLTREAAFTADPYDIDLTAAYAEASAARLVPELVQLCGARSFALGFGLHVFSMRLAGLRSELGGPDRIAEAVLSHDTGLGSISGVRVSQ